MIRDKFPTPKYWLNIEICEAIYKAFKNLASGFELSSPVPDFKSRYPNALESVLGSVEFKSWRLNYDVVEVATLYFVSFSKSQVFLDANKRMAVILTNTFLKINGYELTINPNSLRNMSLLLSNDKTNIEKSAEILLPIFRRHVEKSR